MDASTGGPLVVAGAAVGGYLAKRLVDEAVDRFANSIVRPLADRRARAYFESLLAAVGPSSSAGPATVNSILDRVVADSDSSERVFDFYRRAVLSRSRDLGPRLLAVLTARILRENRQATTLESEVADVAEICTDQELAEFQLYYTLLEREATPNPGAKKLRRDNTYSVFLESDSTNELMSRTKLDSSPRNLSRDVGVWALKFERLGLVEQDVRMSSETYRDERVRGTSIEWRMYVGEGCKLLSELLQLITPASTVAK
jgi:hypothetical protein